MQIKCENCSIVYEVAENHLIIRHPRFLKCTSCGHVFQTPPLPEKTTQEDQTIIPPVEQSDSVPMSLSEIFQTESQEEAFVLENIEEQKSTPQETASGQENIVPPSFQNHISNEADLFAPFELTDEFTPVSDENKTKQKNLFIVLSLLTFISLALIYLLYTGRYYFVREVGFSPALYQKASIKTNIVGEGLSFQNSLFNISHVQNRYQLSVKSKIINTTDSVKNVPVVAIYLKDAEGNVLQKKNAILEKNTLSAGEILPFEVLLQPIAQSARNIEITFEKENE